MRPNNLDEEHVCIRIFNNGIVAITDENGDYLKKVEKLDANPEFHLYGPVNTYDQAIWRADNTCVWFRGRQH